MRTIIHRSLPAPRRMDDPLRLSLPLGADRAPNRDAAQERTLGRAFQPFTSS